LQDNESKSAALMENVDEVYLVVDGDTAKPSNERSQRSPDKKNGTGSHPPLPPQNAHTLLSEIKGWFFTRYQRFNSGTTAEDAENHG
jgi:hypothetical protein